MRKMSATHFGDKTCFFLHHTERQNKELNVEIQILNDYGLLDQHDDRTD